MKGDVALNASADVRIVQDVKEVLTLACRMEEQSIQDYNKWAMECASNADSVSKKLFEDLVGDEGRDYAQYDIEHDNLEKFGEHYLAVLSIERSKQTASGTAQT